MLLLLPIFWAFSEPEYRINEKLNKENFLSNDQKRSEKEKFKISGLIYSSCDTAMIQDPENGEYVEKIIANGLPGTSIIVKGTSTGTVTGRYGDFSMDVANGDVLVISFVGFETQEVLVDEMKRIEVLMKNQSYLLEPGSFRDKYKGIITPPTVSADKAKMVPPPPPSDEPSFYVVETMPEYKGGMERYFASLYTLAAQIGKEKNLLGLVKVEFIVDVKGKPIQARPLDHVDSREALEATGIV